MKELTLQQLASWCGGKVAPEYEAIKVNGIQSDSRKVQPGELFLALRGERVDGHEYISAAKEKGLVRIEGKEYVVKDGDVVLFRFNV